MALYTSIGSTTTQLSDGQIEDALCAALESVGTKKNVVVVPPDYTRKASRAGDLTGMAHRYYGERLKDVIPAVGTHDPMTDDEWESMFPGTPRSLMRYHNWRTDVETIGEVPADFVAEATGGVYRQPWPAQLNRNLWNGDHDLIFSIGQVVPHEVIGMANYNKNLFVGVGGVRGINESHYLSAVYGIERTLGEPDTPLRRILNYAQDTFCGRLPLLFAQTVIGPNEAGESVVRGLYVGDDVECFQRACELSAQVNVVRERPISKAVVYLDPAKFKSTWIGNKAIYRTRKAMADGGELIIVAPGVRTFGEDGEIDRLIRAYGYRPQDEVEGLVARHAELRENLSAAAHLIHGSPEDRFRITYAPGKLTQQEIEGVGYAFGDCDTLANRYAVDDLLQAKRDGWTTSADGEEFYFIRDPALGLWRRDDA